MTTKRKKKREPPTQAWDSTSLPGTVAKLDQGNRNRNRVDARVRISDLKDPSMKDPANISSMDLPMMELRNGKAVCSLLRKAKVKVPRKSVNDRRLNLGSCIREHPLGRIRPKGPLCGHVSKMLKQRTDKSFQFLEKCQGLLKSSIFETEFLYLFATPYCKHAKGMVMCYRTPSLGATRLIMQQIIYCRSNFPWGRLLVID